MDPNVALERIRELINDGESADILLVHAFNDFDTWLSHGGFPPDAWSVET